MNTKHTQPAQPPATVLVVDDEKNIRLLVRATLELDGHEVFEAPDGAIALEAIATRAFDLMVLDLNMPVLDGIGVLTALHEQHAARRPRVIVLSAHGSVATAVKATRLGAVDFLEKPVTPADLRATVAAVLSEPQPASVDLPADDRAGYAGVLDRVRQALRSSDVATAESLLIRAADLGQHDAAYFNLIGVIYELRSQWRLARKMYGKAMSANRHYTPAEQNQRRLYELATFGRTALLPVLGDGHDAVASLCAGHPHVT